MLRIASCLAVCVVLFGACVAPIAPPAAEPEPVQLSFLISGDPTDDAAYQALADTFMAANPDVRVDLLNIPSAGDFRRRLAADFAAGTPPDLFLINYRRYGPFVAGGVIEPVGPYLARSERIDAADFYPQALDAFTWQDTLMCLPQNVSSPVIYYNKQLFGGEVEVHWNPNLEQVVDLFGHKSLGGLVRISDASNEDNPDGENMYGMALELVGNDGQLTDILLTGGSEATEASQAKDPQAQLALFNMLEHPSKVAGLAQMAWEVGPIEAGKMVYDVGRMKSGLDSVADLTAWSRAPFRLKGKDGEHYLVKMRAVPLTFGQGKAEQAQGETTSERLVNEFQNRIEQGEARWRFDLQFMKPGDNANDGRKTWGGEWLPAGEIVIPQVTDKAHAKEMSQAAEDTKFNIWKGKEAHNQGPDAEVFYPHGWTNQARLWAYGQSADNRGAQA